MEQPALQTKGFPGGAVALRQVGERFGDEVVKMPGFAKEIGFVGGDNVDQVDQFLVFPVGCKHAAAVLPEGSHAEGTQPAL